MAYTKTVWVDEVLAAAERFEILKNAGGAVDAVADLANCEIALKTAITTAGTQINAANLNKIEDAIEYLYNKVEQRSVQIIAFDRSVAVEAGSAVAWITIPALIDGWNLVSVEANTGSVTPTAALALNIISGANDLLTSDLELAIGTSYDISTAIDPTYEEMSAGDQLVVEVVSAGGASGLSITLTFEEA